MKNKNKIILFLNKYRKLVATKFLLRNIMVMTNYSIFSAILERKFFSTSRWHVFDGTDYPQKNNKYFIKYKNLIINSIKRNNIQAIYTINPVRNSNIYDYIDKNCFKEKKITKNLTSYKIKNCEEINN